ncbi:hypothetical protein CN692_15475 [Bacillus sp. AFS002410]|uniref:DUF3906 family protein n=1 Tax=Bacillus sp. AFS002410 TaxID=2033481 RepID=UPI000BF241F8|nr:DUF3906 family protein [Bacillus sp. AFS002410]PEJ56975.1 hypothetical protein CN692_15475 [Bacillus sp. AFS002410]
MFLYRFEATIQSRVVPIVILASDDEKAFKLVDTELEKFYVKKPVVKDLLMYEKKKVNQSGGFVLDLEVLSKR